MKFFFIAVFFSFFLAACNYNFYQAKKLEKEEKFEEASVEYSRAYFKYLSLNKEVSTRCDNRYACLNLKYKKAYEENALKTVVELRERYIQFILKNKHPSAYKVLKKALLLVSEDHFFKTEEIYWKKVLLVGKINIPEGRELDIPILGDKIYPIIRFNSSIPNHFIEAIITPRGQFSADDVIYRPIASSFLRYTIQSIGFKYLPLGGKKGRVLFQDSEFISYPLVDFRTPILTEHIGDFSNIPSGKTREQIVLKNRENFNNTTGYWYPTRDFEYSSSIQGQEVQIKLGASRNEFLPHLLYFNGSRIVLDFGLLDLQREKSSFLWGIKRIAGEDNLENLKKNYYYRNYLKSNFFPFYITASSR